jgi:hypothetical protein
VSSVVAGVALVALGIFVCVRSLDSSESSGPRARSPSGSRSWGDLGPPRDYPGPEPDWSDNGYPSPSRSAMYPGNGRGKRW